MIEHLIKTHYSSLLMFVWIKGFAYFLILVSHERSFIVEMDVDGEKLIALIEK